MTPSPTDPQDVEGLLEIARAATQGEWEVAQQASANLKVFARGQGRHRYRDLTVCLTVSRYAPEGTAINVANALHIATFNPERIIALLTRLRAVEAERDALKDRLEITYVWQYVEGGELIKVPAPEGMPDGIDCRDETIKLLDAQVARLTAERGEVVAWRVTGHAGQTWIQTPQPDGERALLEGRGFKITNLIALSTPEPDEAGDITLLRPLPTGPTDEYSGAPTSLGHEAGHE